MSNENRPQLTLVDRVAKLDFLLRDECAQDIGHFSSEISFAEALGINRSTFKNLRDKSGRLYKKDVINGGYVESIERLFALQNNKEDWRSMSFAEFETFWPTHCHDLIISKQVAAIFPAKTYADISGISNTTTLILQALESELLKCEYGLDFENGDTVLSRHSITVIREKKSKQKGLKFASGKETRNPLTSVRLWAPQALDSRLPFAFDVEMTLHQFPDSCMHIQRCRLVASLPLGTATVRLGARKRYPDKPRVRLAPEEHGERHMLLITPDAASSQHPAWVIRLSNGPLNDLTLSDFVEIITCGAAAEITIEIRASLRELVNQLASV